MTEADIPHRRNEAEEMMAAALAPFGWTCTPTFWERYYNDAWVFNLANAVVALTNANKRLADTSTESPADEQRDE